LNAIAIPIAIIIAIAIAIAIDKTYYIYWSFLAFLKAF